MSTSSTLVGFTVPSSNGLGRLALAQRIGVRIPVGSLFVHSGEEPNGGRSAVNRELVGSIPTSGALGCALGGRLVCKTGASASKVRFLDTPPNSLVETLQRRLLK